MRKNGRGRKDERLIIRLENTLFCHPAHNYLGVQCNYFTYFFRQRRHLVTSYKKRFITSQKQGDTDHLKKNTKRYIVRTTVRYINMQFKRLKNSIPTPTIQTLQGESPKSFFLSTTRPLPHRTATEPCF